MKPYSSPTRSHCAAITRPACSTPASVRTAVSHSGVTSSGVSGIRWLTRAVPFCYVSVESQHIDVSIEPLDEYLVIQPSNDETETRSGLILPASAASAVAVRTGIVTAVGSDAGGIEPGDKVLYPREEGFDVRLGGIEVKVIKRESLIARIHD